MLFLQFWLWYAYRFGLPRVFSGAISARWEDLPVGFIYFGQMPLFRRVAGVQQEPAYAGLLKIVFVSIGSQVSCLGELRV